MDMEHVQAAVYPGGSAFLKILICDVFFFTSHLFVTFP
jgi:hypothetical protein